MEGFPFSRALENKVSRLLFQMNIPRAVELLQRVEETDLEVDVANNYKFLAMALSGLNEEKRQLWRKMHDQAKPQVKSKQLRAALAFIMRCAQLRFPICIPCGRKHAHIAGP